ncbi:hypothetical protein TKK_0015419 [Trichogramma kaykai]|uniref:BEN domain-containing protein n=1 Tax=Trichogramma kaykai TaxID=54128 RepID=A0ABD2WA41_9HYME
MSVTAAKVRFVQDKEIHCLPIEDIIEFRKEKPSNKRDFNKNALYQAKWTDEKNPAGVVLPIQIGALACGEEEEKILSTKRVVFPAVNLSDLELYSDNQTDSTSTHEKTMKNEVHDQKKKKMLRNKNIKKAYNKTNVAHLRTYEKNLSHFDQRKIIVDNNLDDSRSASVKGGKSSNDNTQSQTISNVTKVCATKKRLQFPQDDDSTMCKRTKFTPQKGAADLPKNLQNYSDHDDEVDNRQQSTQKDADLVLEGKNKINHGATTSTGTYSSNRINFVNYSDTEDDDYHLSPARDADLVLKGKNKINHDATTSTGTYSSNRINFVNFSDSEDDDYHLSPVRVVNVNNISENNNLPSIRVAGNNVAGNNETGNNLPVINESNEVDENNEDLETHEDLENNEVMEGNEELRDDVPPAQNREDQINLPEPLRVGGYVLYRLRPLRKIDENDLTTTNAIRTPEGGDDVIPQDWPKYYQFDDKIYLGAGKAVNLEFWYLLNRQTPWEFLRELSQLLWSRRILVNRCIKLSKTSIWLENRSPRKQLTPSKYRVLKDLFNDYLDDSDDTRYRKRLFFKAMNRHIGYKIKDLRNAMYTLIPV